ncbi:DNA polymerase III subunit epsilon [Amphiplicatus metriothermophilus]|uniref:DNA polymerase III subunit epsilon n=1 Tax=Amphiplicatus metriothermophilus TaxID=1519374 RepID=A0A239PL54_9PROT|nr:DNA polymerase III subunit epsilon [Amphiplicatus metriothermophilus]MBB5517607.1 DNA polymerase-3 subunit epsilon [Amphiplicatus metriothermophilus]SNT68059.1 DNA polymerase-3 subunit epsilon [Amphiplicatus metriothermophilus]
MRQIVFDLETTGFRFEEGHRIVEIGAVELVHGAVTGRSFHTYVNPERDVPEGAFRVHGLSTEFLADKPAFAAPSVAPAFLDFVGDAQLIAHNGAAFDLPFLNAQLEAYGLRPLANDLLDTLIVARRKFPGAPASLDALCARFGIDTTVRARDGHGALLDSKLLAAVYIELTGGPQAGLDFGRAADEDGAGHGARRRARPRPAPLPSLVTPEEAAAHAAFVEAELGPDSLWARLAAVKSQAAE